MTSHSLSNVARGAAALLAASALGSLGNAQAPWKAGEPIPHVHLPDIRTGEAVDLSQFRGQRLLLIEFASW